MKKIFSLLVAVILLITGIIIAQKLTPTPLDERWAKIEQLAEKQLPESALKELDEIIIQAQKEKNSITAIKAYIYKMRFTLEKDQDKTPELINEFEQFSAKAKDPIERALLYSMTAELYANYYNTNSWTVNERTDIEGNAPKDINEWTSSHFYHKILSLLDISLSNPEFLKNVDVLKIAELLETGKDSRRLMPTLFDFMCQRKIDILSSISGISLLNNSLGNALYFKPAHDFVRFESDSSSAVESKIVETYRQAILFHLNDASPEALLHWDLNRLMYVYSVNNENDLYINSLNELVKKFNQKECVVEVLAKQVAYYLAFSEENKAWRRIAYDICMDGIKRFPDYKRIDLLKNTLSTINQKNIRTTHPDACKPFSKLELNLSTKNIEKLKIEVYKVNATAIEYYTFRQNNRKAETAFPNRTLVDTKRLNVKNDPNFGAVDTTFSIQSGNYGIYEVAVSEDSNNDDASNTAYVVTDFGFISRENGKNKLSYYVLDRQTGLPQKGVTISAFKNKWKGNQYEYMFLSKALTSKNGYCNLLLDSQDYETKLFFERANDKFFSSVSYNYFNGHIESEYNDLNISIFTDRSLYRPGQTVYFKGIAYRADKKSNEVITAKTFEVELFDANDQKISSKKLKTNDFGSFAGEFVLPGSGLNGNYRIEVEGNRADFQVEEYKRPTFEVTLNKPEEQSKFGQQITVNGNVKAYSGYTIGDAKVNFRVTRSSHRYCWWWFEPETEISSGKVTTDKDGKFEIAFVPEKTKNASQTWRGDFYTYTVYADVTDQKGETQQAELSVSVGDKSLFIIANVPDKIEKLANAELTVYTENLQGVRQTTELNYEVYKLAESSIFENDENITKLKTVAKISTGKMMTDGKKLVLDMKKWKSGRYKLVFKTLDAFKNEVTTENTFVLYGEKDKRPPVKTYVWLQTAHTECEPGEKTKISFGTSTQNTMVLYEVMHGNKVLKSKWLKFNNEIKNFEIEFKEEYGAGVNVMFTFMKDEQAFIKQVTITRKKTVKALKPHLSVFRNKLLPGEKAEWTISVPEVKDKKAAEIMVEMYDASLDAIRPHAWSFYPYYNDEVLESTTWSANAFQSSFDYVSVKNEYAEVAENEFDQLNWFGLNIGNNYYYGPKNRRRMNMAVKVELDMVAPMDISVADVVTGKVAGLEVLTKSPPPPPFLSNEMILDTSREKPMIKPRTNFSETAFFYPQLKTDASGNVKFSFTAPESLTRWNVKMLAHTADLYFGQFDTTAVTQKDLMVQMNLPRFVRKSDKLMLSATVTNLSEAQLSAIVMFEMIDPATDKPIKLKKADSKVVALAKNETKSIEWEVSEFSAFELVVCKVTALAGSFSDGEQKYLPVLPDKVLVTESMPISIRANQTRTYSFNSLLKNGSSVDTENLTVEFSSNPAWYAVQALPTMSAPENENALDYFTAYYANTLAGFIANSNPKIAKVFDQWKNATGSREALLSNLQKNKELKNMLLEETPWVMAAQDETEQKRQIALLFDLNMQKNQAQQYLSKLIELQSANGGFSWFKGMPDNRYITQEIILNLARLKRMTAKYSDDKEQESIVKALNYLDMEISKDFSLLKKYNKDYMKQNCIGNIQLFYLHLRSEYPEIPVNEYAVEAVKFYSAQSEKYWTSFSLYGKAMMAIVAHRNGKNQLAMDILKSLKENALKTDEFGMYWAKNNSGYFWNERPIVVQAAIIEAFSEISKNPTDIDEMKIWLLKQKQTQRWDSPMATLNAIYALLYQGADWLANENSVHVTMGNLQINPQATEAGTGYFKMTIAPKDVRSEMGKITVSTTKNSAQTNSSSIGWGAIYWQYFKEQSEVSNQGGALKISKKLYVKSGTSMIPIEQTEIKKGSKVITRLVVTTDRNLEFVALKDLRAACFEPVNQLSGYEWKQGVGYYQTSKDASTQFFFNYLPKGTYVFEYELWANNSGLFCSGVASIQCQYAPEFVSFAGGENITVE